MTTHNAITNLFSAPATAWAAIEDAYNALIAQYETDDLAPALITPSGVTDENPLARYEALCAAHDAISARLSRGVLNAALVAVIIESAPEDKALTRKDICDALAQVAAFQKRNTPEGKDAVPAQTINRAIGLATLYLFGTQKQRAQYGDNAGSNKLGGVAPWKGNTFDAKGLKAAITQCETKSAGKTTQKANNQGKADKDAKPADLAKENKILAEMIRNSGKAMQQQRKDFIETLAAFVKTLDNATLSDAQARNTLRKDVTDALQNLES